MEGKVGVRDEAERKAGFCGGWMDGLLLVGCSLSCWLHKVADKLLQTA